MVQTCTRHGAPFSVLAPEFYNLFSLMRAVPAGANRKMRQHASFFAVIVSGYQTKIAIVLLHCHHHLQRKFLPYCQRRTTDNKQVTHQQAHFSR
jgi:hypothetical protein